MRRAAGGLVIMLCAVGLALAQDKEKKETPRVKATLVKVDRDKKTMTVKMDGKESTLGIGKDVKFFGPKGGKATIKDNRLVKEAPLLLVMEGKTLKEVHLPNRADIPDYKDKGKEKDKGKAKGKDGKDKGKMKDKDDKQAKDKDAKPKDKEAKDMDKS